VFDRLFIVGVRLVVVEVAVVVAFFADELFAKAGVLVELGIARIATCEGKGG
jgi:hypothetical protein